MAEKRLFSVGAWKEAQLGLAVISAMSGYSTTLKNWHIKVLFSFGVQNKEELRLDVVQPIVAEMWEGLTSILH